MRYVVLSAALVLCAVFALGTGSAYGTDFTYLTQWGSAGSANGQFHFPNDVAVDGSGGVYVTVRDDNDPVYGDRLEKFDSAGNWIWTQTGFNDPECMAVRGGVLYVAAGSGNCVRTLDPSSGAVLNNSWATGYGLNYASGIAFDSAGNCYVGSYYTNTVVKYSSAGAYITSWTCAGAAGVAVDASDNVLAVDYNNDYLNKYTNTGTPIWSKGGAGSGPGQFNTPWGLSLDGLGNIYVADSGNNRVQKFDSSGTFVSQWGAPEGAGLNFPGSVDIDKANAVLYACDCNNNRIVKVQLPALAVSQGVDAGRPAAKVFRSASATSVVDKLAMTALGNPLTVSTVTVRGLDASSTLRSDVASVALFRDNGNGTYGSDDTLVSSAATFSADASGTAITFSAVNSVVTPGAPAAFWIVYKIGSAPGDRHEVGSQIRSADVTVANATVLPFSAITSANTGKTIGIDISPPVTTAAGVPVGWSNGATVSLTAIDAYSGVAQTYYTLNSGLPQLYTLPFPVTTEGTNTVAYWSVDNVGNTEASKTTTVRIDTTGPTAPVVSASAATTVAIDVSWTPSADSLSGLDHYSLYGADGTLVTNTMATSYRVSGLAPATAYGFYVRAADLVGNVTQSNTATATTLDAAAPVTTLAYAPPNGNAGWWKVAPLVSATTSKPAVTYYNFTSPTGTWAVLSGTVTPPEGVSVMYYFSSDGVARPEPTRSVQFKVDSQAPPPPVISAMPGGNYSIDLTWNAVTDPASGLADYEVDQATGGFVGRTSHASFHIAGLSPSTAYGYLVKAFDVAGNVSTSNVATATTLGSAVPAGPVPPHVATDKDTDACAMCHRAHTSATEVPTALDASGTRSNALVIGFGIGPGGDVQLCYACHGVDTLGSIHDVESEFTSGPSHLLTPTVSAYGPTHKECSDCHDSHGSAKLPDGSSYPALLRARDASGNLVYSGEAYCETCHAVRAGNEFPGGTLFDKTAHAQLARPTSGTGIVCSICHTPHGSPNAPNIVTSLAPLSVVATAAVSANDRTFCMVCHDTPERTWEGTATYSASAHGSSSATVAIDGDWASATASRKVGECQSCHAAMGAPNGHGGVVPRLAKQVGSAQCYECHRSNGAAKTDLQSLAYRPAPVVSTVIGHASGPDTDQFGELHVYTRDATSSPTISGPRSYLSGRVGAIAAGDIDGSGHDELVVGRPGTSNVTVFSRSQFEGLAPQPGDRTLLAPATYLAIGDVLDDTYKLPELITAATSTGSTSTLRVYRWNVLTATFDNITAVSLQGTVTGLAAGQILGGTLADIAVTTNGPDRLVVLAQNTPTTLAVSGSYPTRALPCGPSIGEINSDGRGEIAVANAGELSPTLSIYSDLGTELMSSGSTVDASPTATAIGNILPGITEAGTSGNEIALALGSASGAEKVEVFPRSAGGLAAPETHTFAAHTDPSSLGVGDVDGDGRDELLVGLGGLRSSVPGDATAPGLAIVHASANGTTLGVTDIRSGGGVELAGQTSVLAANLGAIGPSRHPVEAAQGAHVSTETAPFAEHVACDDCHNVHAATASRPAAPALLGVELGAWGVSMGGPSPTLKTGVTREFELCFKCHADYSGFQPLSGVRSVDAEFDTGNASFHPVEGIAPSTNAIGQTLVGGLTTASRVNCSDCHGNSAGRGSATSGTPNGPHTSPSAPLLVKPLLGSEADDASSLCYGCHRFSVYGDGSDDDGATLSSGFVNNASNAKLHSFHEARGFACESCHVSHGSVSKPFGLRGDVGWVVDNSGNGGGACTNGCHGGTKSYRR